MIKAIFLIFYNEICDFNRKKVAAVLEKSKKAAIFLFVRYISQRTHQDKQIANHIDGRLIGSSGALLVEANPKYTNTSRKKIGVFLLLVSDQALQHTSGHILRVTLAVHQGKNFLLIVNELRRFLEG